MRTLNSLQKRFLIALPLGIAFGFLCSWLANTPALNIWWTPLMWTIVSDRFLIGLCVALAGVYTYHPVFGFRCPSMVRGLVMGIIVSLPLALGAMITPVDNVSAWAMFFATMIAGAIYGMVIDVVATKWGGEGKDLLKYIK